jgi:hypothetical protein
VTAPVDVLKFVATRDAAIGEVFDRIVTAPTLTERLALGQELTNLMFKDIPHAARVD